MGILETMVNFVNEWRQKNVSYSGELNKGNTAQSICKLMKNMV